MRTVNQIICIAVLLGMYGTVKAQDTLSLGYGRVSAKADAAVAADAVGRAVLDKTHSFNPYNSLYGQLPGLFVMQGNAEPWNNSAALYVRGIASMNGNSVITVVDGVPFRDLSALTVDEIADITVLKDAASLALYGNRGADGVIVVNTRRGSVGKGIKISADYNFSLLTPYGIPAMASGIEYASALNQALANDGLAPAFTARDLQSIREGNPIFPQVDWQKEMLARTGQNHDFNLTVDGRGSHLRYFVNVNYNGYRGFFNNTGGNREYDCQAGMHNLKIRTNIEANVTPTTTVRVGVLGRLNQYQYPYTGSGTGYMYYTPAIAFPVKAKDGTWIETNMFRNPLAYLVGRGNSINLDRRLYSDLTITQSLDPLVRGMKISASISYDNAAVIVDTRSKEYSVYRQEYQRDAAGDIVGTTLTKFGEDGTLAFNGGYLGYQEMRFNANAVIDWGRTFGRHQVSASYIFNLESNRYKGANNTGRYQDNILTADYSYDGKYMLNVTANYSGSAKMQQGRKYMLYPAVAAAWILSNEDFLKNSHSISLLKLRASYGLVGYDGRLSYDMDKQFNGGGSSYIFNGTTALGSLAQGGIPSTGIVPELDRKANLGVELGIGKIFTAQLDIFCNRRSGIAVSSVGTLSEVIGRDTPIIFTGETLNMGAELSLGVHGKSGKWGWHADANATYARNKILEQAEAYVPYEWQRSTGRQIGTMLGYVPVGFYADYDFDSTGKLYEGVVGSSLIENLRPGDIKYQDLNGDGTIDSNDMTYQGISAFPTVYFGLNLGFSYGPFGIEAVFQGAADYMVYTGLDNIYRPLYNNDKNVSRHYLENCWTPERTGGVRYPRLTTRSNAHNFASSPVWWEKGDYLKLRTVYLWYDLAFAAGRVNTRIFLRGLNLFSLDRVGIMDPEYISTGYPQARTWQLGLKVSF